MAGGSITRAGVDIRGGINVVDYKTNGVRTRVGLNVDTVAKVDEDGVEAKFLGFGISIGKKTGISTSFGEVSTDKCVVQ